MSSLIIGFIGGLVTGVALTTISIISKNNDIDNMEDTNG